MARPTPTPSFGSSFNASRFRTAIRNTMTMGMPNANADKATFRWTPRNTYNPQDPEHDPYTFTQAAINTWSHADVVVPVAWEFSARPSASLETTVGEFDMSRVVITMLDVDFATISGVQATPVLPDLVLLGGNTYIIEFVAPPVGLFDVDVYQIYCIARDES